MTQNHIQLSNKWTKRLESLHVDSDDPEENKISLVTRTKFGKNPALDVVPEGKKENWTIYVNDRLLSLAFNNMVGNHSSLNGMKFENNGKPIRLPLIVPTNTGQIYIRPSRIQSKL